MQKNSSMKLQKTTRKLSFSRENKLPVAACLCIGAILLLCPTDHSISLADSVPDWLAAAGRVDLGHFGDGSAAVVIVANWKDFAVDASGTFVLTERRAMRILNRRSAERYLQAVGQENNDTKVESIQAWTIAPSGRVTQSSKKDLITQADYPAFELFSDDRVKMINISGAEDGSLVGYQVVTRGRDLINGMNFLMEQEIPIREGELHVSVPSGSMRWFVNHPDRIEVVSQSANDATFRTVNRPGIADEPDAPSVLDSLAANVVVNYDSKGSVGAAVVGRGGAREPSSLYTDSDKPGTEIALSQVEMLCGRQVRRIVQD